MTDQATEVDQGQRTSGEVWPTVTVVVPTRDRPELLHRALESIVGQRYPGDIECVVVFDQSELAMPSVGLRKGRSLAGVSNERTPGLAGARNMGTLASKGDLLAFCDDDDEWLPDKLRLQVEALNSDGRAAVATCGVYVHYDGRTFPRVSPTRLVTLRHLLRSRMMEVHPSTILVRRSELVGRIGLVDEAIPGSYGEDYEWLLRAARCAPLVAVPRPLVRIHWHRSSWFADRWQTISAGLTYLLKKHPEFGQDARGLARIMGQIAFAHAASGQRRVARRWAGRCLRLNWRERRAYLALAVSLGIVRAGTIVRLAHAAGRGI
jgi:glycosyltransferase involved in cell wall biosynthesis